MNAKQPNLFELHRGATAITYSASGIDGRPRLHFEDGERQLDFAGEDIGTLDSEIGKQVTVELSRLPDGETRVLTLLLPQVNLPEGRTDARFRGLVIFTTVRTSIGGPALVQGQVQSYSAKIYRGRARAVDF
jgi:hypothetical protein